MTALTELKAAITSIAEKTGPSIVGIGSRQRGSGVVIADGKVLTNAHNVRGDEVTVTFADGRSTRGTLAGVDWDGDLAVIAVDTGKAKALDWADGGSVDVGAAVFGAVAVVVGGTAGLGRGAPAGLGPLLAMLLAGLEGIGPATRVQVSPPQRKPSTQP